MTTSDTTAGVTEIQTLLVVEDEILIRFQICDYLRECGFRVIEAASADEALIVLQESDLPVNIVLSDVEMPGTMDGFGLSKWLRANRPGIPIILVGSPARAAEAAAELCENGPLLSKPYEPQILLDRIKRILAERK
jgi:DNA-binding response OmpR family regulator